MSVTKLSLFLLHWFMISGSWYDLEDFMTSAILQGC